MFGASATLGLGRSLLGEYASVMAGAMRREQAGQAKSASSPVVKSMPASVPHVDETVRAPLETVFTLAQLIADCERHALSSDQIIEYARRIEQAAAHLLGHVEAPTSDEEG